ncbi:MAG: HlyD family efflux transporter periplasmic adaptor subunit [Trueperaceae bacterium]|nr:HlyD family efflux transporter periplasmic adaptor subunit [Trueperaceae bacterium]
MDCRAAPSPARTSTTPANRRRGSPVLAAALALALTACGGGSGDEGTAGAAGGAANPTPTESVRTVRVVTLEAGELRATRRATATVRPARESRVAAGANGRVAELLAREGTLVAAGDPLVRLDDAALRRSLDGAELAREQARINVERAQRSREDTIAQAEAAARAAEGNLALALRQYEEAEALLAVGAVASADVQALRAQRDQAESAALQARDALARSRRAEGEDIALLDLQLRQAEVQVRQAREAVDEAVVRAPFDGEVAELFTEVGEFIAAGSPVARVLGSGAQLASFSVPPEDAPRIEALGTVSVAWAGREIPATVTFVERQAQQSRLATITATLGEGAPPVASGSVAEVRYEVVLGEGLVVPSGALSADAGRTYVFLVAGDDEAPVARRVEVRVVVESGNRAVVLGVPDGSLEVGAVVVSPRPLDVRDGTRVRVVEVGAADTP